MAFRADGIKHPVFGQILGIHRKFRVLEGERSADYECEKNTETIRQLRQENKRLRRELEETNADDENFIKVAFHNRGKGGEVYRNKSRKTVLSAQEHRVLFKAKRLNALKHTTQTLWQRLEELKMEYQSLKPEGSNGAKSATRKKEEDARNLQALENRLEKILFKCKEAEIIKINYQKLQSYLQEESLTFHGRLDSLEAEILKHREELYNMQIVNNDTQLTKAAVKAELQQQEELFYKERKERERIIASYRKKAAECKVDGSVMHMTTAVPPNELSSEAQRSSPRLAGEEEKTISTLEEAFRHIEEAIGVTNIKVMVKRFISQMEKHQHLESLREQNEKVLQQLKEQRELLNQQLQEMKYSGEAKLSSDQQVLEECEQQLQAQQRRCDAAEECLEWLSTTRSTVRAWVKHLEDKLQHITLSEDTAAEVSPDSNKFVLELMTQCELKLQLLFEELQGKDLAAIRKEMEEEEFNIRTEWKLPDYNTRVKLHEDHRLDLFDDEEESEEEKADVITREALKRQSQLIIDLKSRMKPLKRKKKKKGQF